MNSGFRIHQLESRGEKASFCYYPHRGALELKEGTDVRMVWQGKALHGNSWRLWVFFNLLWVRHAGGEVGGAETGLISGDGEGQNILGRSKAQTQTWGWTWMGPPCKS